MMIQIMACVAHELGVYTESVASDHRTNKGVYRYKLGHVPRISFVTRNVEGQTPGTGSTLQTCTAHVLVSDPCYWCQCLHILQALVCVLYTLSSQFQD